MANTRPQAPSSLRGQLNGSPSSSSSKPCVGPILIVCFTNHALDAYLMGLLHADIKDLVRMGGQSKMEELAEYSLVNRCKGEKSQENRALESGLRRCGPKMQWLCLACCRCTAAVLLPVTSGGCREQLSAVCPDAGCLSSCHHAWVHGSRKLASRLSCNIWHPPVLRAVCSLCLSLFARHQPLGRCPEPLT